MYTDKDKESVRIRFIFRNVKRIHDFNGLPRTYVEIAALCAQSEFDDLEPNVVV